MVGILLITHAPLGRAFIEAVTHVFKAAPERVEALDVIADQINNRPRKGLGVRSPLAVYRDLLLNRPQHSTLVH